MAKPSSHLIDYYLREACTKELIGEIKRRHLSYVDAERVLELERGIISYADDDDLIDEIETRGFKISRNKDDDNWYEIARRDWYELADLVARGSTREVLELVEYLSNGIINSTSIINLARLAR